MTGSGPMEAPRRRSRGASASRGVRSASEPMRSDEIHPGDLIAGKYRVRAILSRTRGLLVEAFHTEFDQRVIIKILPAGLSDDREIERFRREVRTLAKLESEHVARIIDVGSQDDGSFYLVRQHLEGTDLARYIRQSGPLPLQDATLLVLQAAEAVAETNGHGIIVRELQPSHLFLTQRAGGTPLIKIIDFGTAKLMRDSAAPSAGGELTATAMFGLSPYSSPELVRKAKSVDQRTDVWSLGAILYELLTGRPPFSGDTATLMLQIAKEEPVPVTQYRPDLPAEIDAIIGWALAKDVDGRFRNVHAFAHALTPYASAEGQLLIERIGQITHAAKQRKRVVASVPPPAGGPGYLPPPTPPPGRLPSEDTITSVKEGGFSSTQPPPPPSYGPGGTVSPGLSSSGSAPSSRTERAQSGRMSGGSGGSRSEASPQAGSVQPSTVRAVPSPPPSRGSRRILYSVLAALAVVVPILVTIFVLQRPSSGPATADSGGPIEIPVPTTTPVASAAPEPAPEPTPVASAPPAPVESASATPAASASAQPDKIAGRGGTSSSQPGGPRTSKTSASSPPPPRPPEPPPSSGGGSSGTIVAVATGGSCAFSVNGASKGTSSSIKVNVPPGTYSITCKPASGSAKSKSVKVESGKTAFAAFKL